MVLAVLFMLVALPALARVVTIFPSGDMTGATDQAAIQSALDAAGTNKDTKINLGEGTFYLNGGVKANGFRGTLRGTGKQETEIIALGEGDRENNRGSVFLFEGGDATVKDLSINVPDGSSYRDSAPYLGLSDGGAAIDILNGSATIKNVGIFSNGPFLLFGEESLETGILVHNGTGKFTLQNSTFEGNKRAFIFNPEEPSQLDLELKENDFTNNRSGIFLLDFGEGNDGSASIRNNKFNDNLAGDVGGFITRYPVAVTDNVFRHSLSVGNSAIGFDGTGPLTIKNNDTDGQYFLPNIHLVDHTGGAVIADNTVRGTSMEGLGAIGAERSESFVIENNLLLQDESASIPSGLGVSIVDSRNASIKDNEILFADDVLDPVHILLDESTTDSTVVGKGNETVLDEAEFDEDIIVNDRVLDCFSNIPLEQLAFGCLLFSEGQQVFQLSATPTGAVDFVVVSPGLILPNFSIDPSVSPVTVTLDTPLQADQQLFIQYESTDVLFSYTGCGAASGAGMRFDRSNAETVVVLLSSPFANPVEVETFSECTEVDKNNTILDVAEIIGFN